MHIYDSQLLLPYNHKSSSWFATDSQDLYVKNLSTQPRDWLYRQQSVSYQFNSNGYRAPEWNLIDWTQSHLIMGCSHAMGVGIDQQHTLAAEIPYAVNLAQPGVSIYHIQYNTLRLIDQGIRPRSVQILIPDLHRSTYWGLVDWADLTPHDFAVRGQGLRDHVRCYYQGMISQDPQAQQMAAMTARSVKALWTAQGIDCDLWDLWFTDKKFHTGRRLSEPVDQARDIDAQSQAHPGIHTVQHWADQIKHQLNKYTHADRVFGAVPKTTT